jgi:hypothetical protein
MSLDNLFTPNCDGLTVHSHAIYCLPLVHHHLMPSTIITLIVLTFAVLGGFYQIYVHPVIRVWGVFEPSEVPNIGMRDCLKVDGLSACESEKISCVPVSRIVPGGPLTFYLRRGCLASTNRSPLPRLLNTIKLSTHVY